MDWAIKPSEWVLLVPTADHSDPFDIIFVEYSLTNDMKNDGTPVIKVFDFKYIFDPLLKACEGMSKFRGVVLKWF